MLTLPEVILGLEQRLGNGRLVLPVLPTRPVLAEIPAVPEHVRAKGGVGKNEIVTVLR